MRSESPTMFAAGWMSSSSSSSSSSSMFVRCALALIAFLIVQASPIADDGQLTSSVHTVFQSRLQNDTKLRFVRDSGVCETTPNVSQVSGYVDIGPKMSMVGHFSTVQCTVHAFIFRSPVVLVFRGKEQPRDSSFHSLVRFTRITFSNSWLTAVFSRLNGGPGCSSMIGLFQGRTSLYFPCLHLTDVLHLENGPCTVLEDGQTTELNPFSWNNISNSS